MFIALLKGLLSLLGLGSLLKEQVKRQEDINTGKLQETAAAQAQEIKDVTLKNNIDNRIDSASGADADRMRADLDAADR